MGMHLDARAMTRGQVGRVAHAVLPINVEHGDSDAQLLADAGEHQWEWRGAGLGVVWERACIACLARLAGRHAALLFFGPGHWLGWTA